MWKAIRLPGGGNSCGVNLHKSLKYLSRKLIHRLNILVKMTREGRVEGKKENIDLELHFGERFFDSGLCLKWKGEHLPRTIPDDVDNLQLSFFLRHCGREH
jgi:hypothetical protein